MSVSKLIEVIEKATPQRLDIHYAPSAGVANYEVFSIEDLKTLVAQRKELLEIVKLFVAVQPDECEIEKDFCENHGIDLKSQPNGECLIARSRKAILATAKRKKK